jgi:hypothetical protein
VAAEAATGFKERKSSCLAPKFTCHSHRRAPQHVVANCLRQLPEHLPPGVRTFRYLPFSQILPHCAALVYPGGISTMAQAIQAGISHLVAPYAHDQPDNALRIRRLGLGFTIYPKRYEPRRAARLFMKRVLIRKPSIQSLLPPRLWMFANRFPDGLRRRGRLHSALADLYVLAFEPRSEGAAQMEFDS